MKDYYLKLLENEENMRGSFSWITDEQYKYIKQNFHDLECNLKVFISYSSKDKHIAAIIKNALSNLGQSSFLAHEDIVPSKEWQDEIINELKTCNVFVPLINENIKESEWTSQETGAAFINDMEIIPISVYLPNQSFIQPYGFISKYQALKWTIDHNILNTNPAKITSDIQEKIVQAFISKNKIIENVRNCFINSLVNSSNYTGSIMKSESISYLNPFEMEQLRMLVFGYIFNDQIRNSNVASPVVKKLIDDNKKQLDDITRSIYENHNL